MATAEPTPIRALLNPTGHTPPPATAGSAAPMSRPNLRLSSFLPAPAAPARDPNGHPSTSAPSSPWPQTTPTAGPDAPAAAAQLQLEVLPETPPAPQADTHPTPAHPVPAADPTAPTPPAALPAPAPTPPPAEEAEVAAGPLALRPPAEVPVATRSPALTTDLTHDRLVLHHRDRPTSGWRAALYTATGGLLNPGLSLRDRDLAQLHALIRTPLRGVGHRVAVLAGKGGVGRTTVAAGLAATLAEVRGDQVVAVDAAPEAGTLADRLVGPPPVTIRELLRRIANSAQPPTLPELDSYLRLAGRLRVLASQLDPAATTTLEPGEYQQVMQLLGRHIGIAVTDTGTGPAHPLTRSVLHAADSLVVVGTLTVDGASRAAHTLDWLANHGRHAHATNSVVVLTGDHRSRDIDLDAVRDHFTSRVRALVEIPHDPHLASGGRLDPTRLRRTTRDAFTQVAAAVATQFAGSRALA